MASPSATILSYLSIAWDGDLGPVLTVLWRAVVLSPVLDLKVPIVSTILPCQFEGDVKEFRLIFKKRGGSRFRWCGLSPIEWGELSSARNNYPYAVAITLGSMPFGRTRERQKSSLRSPRQEYARSVATLDNILTGGNDSKTSTGSRPPGPSLFWRSSWKNKTEKRTLY